MKKLASIGILIVTLGYMHGCGTQNSLVPQEEYLNSNGFEIEHNEEEGVINISPVGIDHVILSQHAGEYFRPYIHPIIAPDGRGEFTEFRPSHHPHQTALFFGFPQVNGRDFYHNPTGGGPWRGDQFWSKVSAEVINEGSEDGVVRWKTVYDMLDIYGEVMMTETQIWSLQRDNGKYLLDLEWSGEAKRDI
ncbi:MAG: DUF6807 family protein, partial [Balneolaceae bacterium]